ncbi:aminoglycoside phosphotransferase family protein, partial [Patescibacteria group bacterium]|nr:aminoglycoside phosphotransferase family protein [Patescibacteria group bacterium]
IQLVGSGNISQTFSVETTAGRFVLQRIGTVIPDGAVRDMATVTDLLVARGLHVPSLLCTASGDLFARDDEGARWRVYPWIPGRVLNTISDAAMAKEAGRMVGVLHQAFAEMEYRPQGSIPHFHDTAFILEELSSIEETLPTDELRRIAKDISTTLPGIILDDAAAGESRMLIHGDLKIGNIIFADAGVAVGVIDFDTLLWHYRAIDLGDAFRSWCNRTTEGDANAIFDTSFFNAAEEGYAAGWGKPVTAKERAVHLRATKQITLELAARFLIDVVRDSYFGFDATHYPDRRSHNIARALGQYHLAGTIPVA